VLEEHVAPEHEGFAVAGGFFLEEADMVEVLAGEVGGGGVGLAPAEVVGFVAAEVEAGGGEAGQEFGEDGAQEFLGVGVAGMDGAAAEALEPGGGFPGGGGEFDFGEFAVGGRERMRPMWPKQVKEGVSSMKWSRQKGRGRGGLRRSRRRRRRRWRGRR
jgi:hypothetical protein